jgi:hypothetical protein
MKSILVPVDTTNPIRVVDVNGYDEIVKSIGGGWLQAIYPFEESVSCFIDEEGKLKALPVNVRATDLVKHALMADDLINGEMLIMGIDYETGEEVDLSEEFILKIMEKN